MPSLWPFVKSPDSGCMTWKEPNVSEWWHVFNEAMSYRQRISGWWLFNIIIWSMLAGGLLEAFR